MAVAKLYRMKLGLPTKPKKTLAKKIRTIVKRSQETKVFDGFAENTNLYSYAGSAHYNLFTPAIGTGSSQVIGQEATLQKANIKVEIRKHSSIVSQQVRMIVFFWHDVTDTPTYQDLFNEPPSPNDQLFPLSPLHWGHKHRYTLLTDKHFDLHTDKESQYRSLNINLRDRKIRQESGTAYNPRLFIMFIASGAIATPARLYLVSRVTYKDG